jgi:hypothetical protein
MGIGAMIVSLVVAGLMVATVITIVYLTAKKLKELIQKRKEKNRRSKVAFGETRKIVEESAREILANAPSMTMEDLEKTCEETPYFVVDYDPNTDEVSDYTTIKTDSTDEKIENIMSQNDGIILFD